MNGRRRKLNSGSIFSVPYHGNYVGPYWSAGKNQGSVAYSDVPPVDDFDRTALEHDRVYAEHGNLKAADEKFFRNNWGKGFKRSVAAAAVGIQGYFRSSPEKEMPKRKRSITDVGPLRKVLRLRGGARDGVPSRNVSYNAQLKMARKYAKSPKYKKGKYRYKGKGRKTYRRKKFKKSYKKKGFVSRKKMNVSVLETAGSVTHGEAVYVGHGAPKYHILLSCVKQVWKSLVEKAGFQILNWTDVAPNTLNRSYFNIVFADSFDQKTGYNPSVQCFGALPGFLQRTHQQIAEEMVNQIITLMPATANAQINWDKAEYFMFSEPGTYDMRIPMATLDLKSFVIDLEFTSKLTMQNVTPSSAGADAYEANNITSNPLKVTGYVNSKQVTGLYPMWVSDIGVSDEDAFLADRYTGQIITTPAALGETGTQLFRKPPSPKVFDCAKKGHEFTLIPGGFYISHVKWKCVNTFHTFMRKYSSSFFKTATSNTPLPLGNLKLYGMEHVLKQLADVNVTVNWQIEHVIKTSGRVRGQMTQPFISLYDD